MKQQTLPSRGISLPNLRMYPPEAMFKQRRQWEKLLITPLTDNSGNLGFLSQSPSPAGTAASRSFIASAACSASVPHVPAPIIPASCRHSTWSPQHASLHHNRLGGLLGSRGPSNPHFEGGLQDLRGGGEGDHVFLFPWFQVHMNDEH